MTIDQASIEIHREENAQAMLDALDRLRGYAVEYGGFLANHGPMAADAMIRLGGRHLVAGWVDRYVAALEPARPTTDPISVNTWPAKLGRPDLASDWVHLFTTSIAEVGWNETVANWWPRLLPGIAASAAHGVIRTAHAIRNLHEYGEHEPLLLDELANGLGLWAARYQPLPTPSRNGADLELRDAIVGLPSLEPDTPPIGSGIGGRLGALDRLNTFQAAVARWRPSTNAAAALDELQFCASRLLIANHHNPIPLCHAITAPAAAQMVLPALPDDQHENTVLGCWTLVAAIITAYTDPLSSEAQLQDSGTLEPPSNLGEQALEHGDEHVLKLTAAAIDNDRRTQDTTMSAAAHTLASRLQRVPG